MLWILYVKQDDRHHRTIEMETAFAMEIMDQLSTYIHVYVDNYQNNRYIKDDEIVRDVN